MNITLNRDLSFRVYSKFIEYKQTLQDLKDKDMLTDDGLEALESVEQLFNEIIEYSEGKED